MVESAGGDGLDLGSVTANWAESRLLRLGSDWSTPARKSKLEETGAIFAVPDRVFEMDGSVGRWPGSSCGQYWNVMLQRRFQVLNASFIKTTGQYVARDENHVQVYCKLRVAFIRRYKIRNSTFVTKAEILANKAEKESGT